MRLTTDLRRLGSGAFLAAMFGAAACLLPAHAIAQDAEAAAVEAAAQAVPASELREPDSLEQLQDLQDRVRAVVDKATPATVCIRAGGGSGSGVIVSEDGLVLTAGHVAVRPGQRMTFIFPDGSTARGESLGVNEGIDSGLARITDEGPWPFVEMGALDGIERGDWCVAMGHPGGFDEDRPIVARLGRVILSRDEVVQSNCTIIGGDSGGPLFDLDGRVIGIHSRIGGGLTANFHVPITTYTQTWDRLLAGEIWNRSMPGGGLRPGDPYIGVRPDRRGGAVLGEIMRGEAADRAGLQRGDRVTAIDEKSVESFGDIVYELRSREPGDVVVVTVERGDQTLELDLEIGSYAPDEGE